MIINDFMNKAINISKKSLDPNTKVGCCIVKDDIVLSYGYNKFPSKCKKNDFPWKRDGEFLETKYPYVLHAEVDAVINAKCDLSNSTVYVTLFPCNECSKVLIEAGIKKIFYLEDKYYEQKTTIASKKLLDSANVLYIHMK